MQAVILFLLTICLQKAMDTMNMTDNEQLAVMQIVAGILHLGNIAFQEVNNYAQPDNEDCK